MKKILFISFLVFHFSCASKIFIDKFLNKPFKTKKQTINELRFNGAYYNIDKRSKVLNVLFFYENYLSRSLVFDTNHYDQKKIKYSINLTLEKFRVSKKKSYEHFEDGGYRLTENEISIQKIRYIPQFAWGVVTYNGKIINDTTILITEFKFPKRNIFISDSMYYHFIEVERPDSLKSNRWLKKKWYWND
mgnify:CR=1 FL=1